MRLSRFTKFLWWIPPIAAALFAARVPIPPTANINAAREELLRDSVLGFAMLYVLIVFIGRSIAAALHPPKISARRDPNSTLVLVPMLVGFWQRPNRNSASRFDRGMVGAFAGLAFLLAAFLIGALDATRYGEWSPFVIQAVSLCLALLLWKFVDFLRGQRPVYVFGAVVAMLYFCVGGPVYAYIGNLFGMDSWFGEFSLVGMVTILPGAICLWKFLDWMGQKNRSEDPIAMTANG